MLRWLGRPPEDFVPGARPGTLGVPLPPAGTDQRPRWDLVALYEALNAERIERGATWQQAARSLRCTPSQLTGLRTAKFATSMRVAMRICQSLGRPAADFVHPATW